MKKTKAVWILTFSGILLMLSFIVLGNALVAEFSRLNGDYSVQKVLVSVKNQLDLQGINSFSIDDIKNLERELAAEDISYMAQSGLINTPVNSGGTAVPVKLTGVDYMYSLFSGLTLEEGSFITQKHEEDGTLVAVIDDELAWKLFKTVNATGKTIDIFGSVFRIVGVVKKEDTIVEKLTDYGLPNVYIPAAVMLELDNTAQITALQIKSADIGTLDQNTINVSTALRQIGKDPANYNIGDYNLKFMLLNQQPLLFIFILGSASIFILLMHIKSVIKELYVLIKDGCRIDYFTNVIKFNLMKIGGCIFEMVVALMGIMFIWLGIRFKLYIPPQNIPDELINVSYYSDLIKGLIQSNVQNMGYVPPQIELIFDAVNSLISLLFFISVALGFLLLYTGFREFKALNMDTNRLTVILGLFCILALALLALITLVTGLTFMLDVKGVLVAWVFVFLNILNITKRKESDIENV